jgi:selenocysteine-specific elongation factor
MSSNATFLESLRSSGKEERTILLANEYGASGLDVARLQSEMGCDRREAVALLRCGLESESLCGSDSFAVTTSVLIEWAAAVKKFIEKSISEEELSDGVSFSSIRSSFPILSEKFFSLIIGYLCSSDGMQLSGEFISPKNYSTSLSEIEDAVSKKIVSTLIERRFEGLKKAELKELVAADEKVFEKVLGFLIKKNQIKLVSNEFLFAAVALEEIKKSVCEFADSSTDRVIDVPVFKSITGLSRKYAIPLLEYLDLEKVTVRSGDKRVVIKKSL